MTNATPLPKYLGTVNGTAASIGCLARSVGAAISGSMFHVGLTNGFIGLPFWTLAAISAIGGPLRLTDAQRTRLWDEFVPWALRCGGSARCLISVYWEERWTQDVEEMKREFGIWDPPEVRQTRPLKKKVE